MLAGLRRALRAADAVACISAPLARHVREDYGYAGPLAVVENAIPAGMFAPRERDECRRALGLPLEAELVGTAGALSPTRGTDLLVAAFERMAQSRPHLHLVLAGPLDAGQQLPAHPRLHYLGLLPPAQVPALICALDVAVVANVDSAFGRYCFPQKLYEALACRVPVVVADLGAMAELLAPWPQNRYRAGDVDALAAALAAQLQSPSLPSLPIPTGDELAQRTLELCTQASAARA
jgi:glycosyltransferase involved in cell wall biosynthesis